MDHVGGVSRRLRAAVALSLVAVATGLAPPAGHAQAPLRDCPLPVPAADFTDRGGIPDAHVRNVDCAAFFDIAAGFPDGTYRPHLPVRRDQMASFIVRALEAADVELPAAAQGRDFADVPAGSPHRDSIRRLEAAGVVRGGAHGRAENQYGPALPIRRDQMASMLDRTATVAFLGLGPGGSRATGLGSAATPASFPDVPAAGVHAVHIQQAAADGLVRGFGDGTFRPRLHTRRDHMASFMTRLLHVLTVPVRVDLTGPPPTTVLVGETVTVTATVYTQFGIPASTHVCATAGEDVRFFNSRVCAVTFRTNAGAPTQEDVVEPDVTGQARWSFTTTSPGPVTVSASIRGPGGLHRSAGGDSDTAQLVVVPRP